MRAVRALDTREDISSDSAEGAPPPPKVAIRDRAVVRNVSLNLGGQIIPLMVAVVTIPALIRGMGSEGFGLLALFLATIGYFGLLDLGLGRALTHQIARRLDEPDTELDSLIWASLAAMAICGIAGALVLGVFSGWILANVLNVPASLYQEGLKAFHILALSIPFVITSAGFVGILAAHRRFDLINLVGIPMSSMAYIAPVLALPFTRSLTVSVLAIVLVRITGWIAYAIICTRLHPPGRLSRAESITKVWPLVRFGGWMTISNLIGPIMLYLDRFMVGVLLSMTAVSYYVAPYEIVTRMWIIPGALLPVLFPAFSSTYVHDRPRGQALLRGGIHAVYLSVFPITLVLVTMAPDLLSIWLGTAFSANSARVLQWLALGVFLNSIAQVPFAAIQGCGRPDLTAKVHLIELPLYLVAFWYLVGVWGIEGAAMAWVGRIAVDAVLIIAIAVRQRLVLLTSLRWSAIAVSAGLPILALASSLNTLPIRMAFLTLTLAGFILVTRWEFAAAARMGSRGWQNLRRSF